VLTKQKTSKINKIYLSIIFLNKDYSKLIQRLYKLQVKNKDYSKLHLLNIHFLILFSFSFKFHIFSFPLYKNRHKHPQELVEYLFLYRDSSHSFFTWGTI